MRKQICECGCGKEAYFNQLTVVEVVEATDATRRETRTRGYYVTRKCKEPFQEELAMTILLRQLSTAWCPKPAKKLWLINAWLNPLYPWPLHLFNYCRRVIAARQVMRLQYAICERTKGFNYARVRSLNSAILFGAPRFMQGFLARRLMGRLVKAEIQSLEEKAVSQKSVPISGLN